MSSDPSPAPSRPRPASAVAGVLEDLASITARTADEMIESMFVACDDHFFDLASRAKSNQDQNRYFESLREIRGRKAQVAKDYTRLLEQRARDFARPGTTARPQPAMAARVESLTLVGEEQAEREAIITDMVARARLEWTDELYQLNERLLVLLPKHGEPGDIPFDPGALTRCFVLASEAIDLDLRIRKVLYRQFERHVLAGLDELYYPLNQCLIAAGILPGLTPLSPRKVRKYDLPDGSAARKPAESGSAATQDALAGIPDSDPDMQELAHLLRRLRTGGVRMPMFPDMPSGAQAGPPIEREELLSLLSDVSVPATEPGGEPRPLDIRHAIEAIIASRGQLRVGQADEDVINVVAMFFDIILDDRNLPIEIQALVSRLQIPILKVALRDRSFFTDRKHPARLLINEIARTSIGWESSSRDTQDALFIRITELVEEVLRSSPDQMDVFERCLSDLTNFIERNEQRAAKLERRNSEKAQAEARTSRARDMVRHALQERLEGKSMPASIASFLVEEWQQVLQLMYLRTGNESPEWIEAVQAVDDLVWSMQPHTDDKSRARLERLLPDLMQRLEAGLTNIRSSPEDARARVALIRALYPNLAGASGAADVEEPAAPLTPSQIEQITPAVPDEKSWRDMTAVERQKVQYEALMYEYLKRVDELPMGRWFEYDDLRRGVTRRCKLSTRVPETQTCIFVNRVGVQVFEKPRKAFAYDLQMGHARALEDAPLFDRTIERITANLRKLAGETQAV